MHDRGFELINSDLFLQMKSNIPRPGMPSSRQKASLELPKNIRCPKGTVLIKRVQKEDLLMAKFSPSFWMNEPPSGHQVRASQNLNQSSCYDGFHLFNPFTLNLYCFDITREGKWKVS